MNWFSMRPPREALRAESRMRDAMVIAGRERRVTVTVPARPCHGTVAEPRHDARMQPTATDFVVEHLPAPAQTLRIACVTETYLPEVNGVATTLARFVDGLHRCGHDVQLVPLGEEGVRERSALADPPHSSFSTSSHRPLPRLGRRSESCR